MTPARTFSPTSASSCFDVFPLLVPPSLPRGCRVGGLREESMPLFFSRQVVSDSSQRCGLALQAPLSMGFSRQEFCSGLPCPPPRWGSIRPRGSNPPLLYLLHWQAGSLPLAPPGKLVSSPTLLKLYRRRNGDCYCLDPYRIPLPDYVTSFYSLGRGQSS